MLDPASPGRPVVDRYRNDCPWGTGRMFQAPALGIIRRCQRQVCPTQLALVVNSSSGVNILQLESRQPGGTQGTGFPLTFAFSLECSVCGWRLPTQHDSRPAPDPGQGPGIAGAQAASCVASCVLMSG